MTSSILNLVGVACGFVGTIVTTFSAGLYFKLVDVSIGAVEMTLREFLNGNAGIPLITGLDKHRETAMRRNKRRVYAGLLLIAAGFGLQIMAALQSQ